MKDIFRFLVGTMAVLAPGLANAQLQTQGQTFSAPAVQADRPPAMPPNPYQGNIFLPYSQKGKPIGPMRAPAADEPLPPPPPRAISKPNRADRIKKADERKLQGSDSSTVDRKSKEGGITH